MAGYWATLDLQVEMVNPFNSSLPNDVYTLPYTVASRTETEPMILFPVSLGILGLAIIFYILGIAKTSSTMKGVCTLLTPHQDHVAQDAMREWVADVLS